MLRTLPSTSGALMTHYLLMVIWTIKIHINMDCIEILLIKLMLLICVWCRFIRGYIANTPMEAILLERIPNSLNKVLTTFLSEFLSKRVCLPPNNNNEKYTTPVKIEQTTKWFM